MSTSQTPQQVLDLYVNIDLRKGEHPLKYTQPINTCTKYRNDFTSVLEKCSFPSCPAPAFCHLSTPHPFCQRTQVTLESNKLEYLTSNGLCIGCLKKKVCCLVEDHPPNNSSNESKEINYVLQKLEALDDKLTNNHKDITKLNSSFRFLANQILDPWEGIHSEMTEIMKEESKHFKPAIKEYYNIPGNECMFLGSLPHHIPIINSHIWPKRTLGAGLDEFFSLSKDDINNPRNFLRLHKEIERAFDKKYIYFEIENNHLKMKVVNPAYLDLSNPIQIDKGNGNFTTFQELNNQLGFFSFISGLPFHRILGQHAIATIERAKSYGWIRISDFDDSINFSLEKVRESLEAGTVEYERFLSFRK